MPFKTFLDFFPSGNVNAAYKDQLRLSPDQVVVPGSAIEATEAPKPAQDPYKPPETTTVKQY